MSVAKMNVWVTRIGDPCHIDLQHQWFVHVLDCEGRIVRWCKNGQPFAYTNIKTKCGHAEFDIPPGCYVVCATWSPGQGSGHLGNHLTHLAVVRVNCGDDACVTLFPPTLHHCRTWFEVALGDHAAAGALPREQVGKALEGIKAALANVPADPFTQAMLEIRQRPAGDQES